MERAVGMESHTVLAYRPLQTLVLFAECGNAEFRVLFILQFGGKDQCMWAGT